MVLGKGDVRHCKTDKLGRRKSILVFVLDRVMMTTRISFSETPDHMLLTIFGVLFNYDISFDCEVSKT